MEPRRQPRAVATTVCSGTRHRVALIGKKIVLLDHPPEELPKLRAARVLGRPCRCLEVLDHWQKADFPHIPKALREHRPIGRPRRRLADREDDEATVRAFELASRFIVRHYTFSQARWLDNTTTILIRILADSPAVRFVINGPPFKRRARPVTDSYYCLSIGLPSDWLTNVYAVYPHGIPTHPDKAPRLILQNYGHGRVTALHQGPGHRNVRLRQANIQKTEHGLRLVWCPDEGRGHFGQTTGDDQ